MKINYFCVENEQINGTTYAIERGWGNGYLVLPKGHPLWELHYDQINQSPYMEAHGGWTFSNSYSNLKKMKDKMITDGHSFEFNSDDWIIGFDTAHHNDSLRNWPRKEVFKHIRELADYYSKEENFI